MKPAVTNRLAFAFLALIGLSKIATAQSSAGALASVEGRVESSVTGDAVPGANVHLGCMTVKVEGVKCAHMAATAGADGAFRFDQVVPGSYLLFGTAERFVGMFGTMPTVGLDAGQQLSHMVLRMNPEATISGKVEDEAGEAVAGAAIEALAVNRSRGHSRLSRVATATTDKSGAYRLVRLTPGRYYISAQKLAGSPRFFYPNALSVEQTSALMVEPGQSYDGTSIRVRAVTTHRIEGKIAGLTASDDKQQKVTLRFAARNEMEASLLSRDVHLAPDGTFAIEDVLPGSYVLQLRGITALSGADSRTQAMLVHLLAKQEVEVGSGDVTGLALVVPPPITVAGRVVLDGQGNVDVAQAQISLRPADTTGSSNYKSVKAQPDGSFRLTACDPTSYAVHVAAPAGTYVSAVEFNRQDAMTHLLDLSGGAGGELAVTLRSGTAEFSGTIQADASAGEQVGSRTPAMVLLIPGDWSPEVWQDLPRTAIREHSFSLKNLAPGRYVAVALEMMGSNSELWQDPDFIRALQSKGQAVELRESDHQPASLVLLSEEEVKGISAGLISN